MVAETIGGLILAFVVGIVRMLAALKRELPAVVTALAALLLVSSPLVIEGVRNYRRFQNANSRTRRTPSDP
jgi:hypothetical protein